DEICGVPLAGFGQIELWSTHDGGDTWSGPSIVVADGADITDPQNPNCGATGHLQVAPALAIGPKREIYVVWQSGPQFFADGSNGDTDAIAFARSLDGGKTFSKPGVVVDINAMRANPPVGYAKNRMNDQARIAVDTSGPHRGRIYVSFYQPVAPVAGPPGQQQSTSSQAYVTFSDDRGNTWSAPTPVAAAVPATGVKRFWTTVTTRASGDVDVVYLESQETATGTACSVAFNPTSFRTGPLNSLVDTFWVQSRDGGATFSSPVRVSTQTSNWCLAPYQFDALLQADGFLVSNAGDYIGTASVDNRTLVLWPDDRNGPMDTFFGSVSGVATVHHHQAGANGSPANGGSPASGGSNDE
ncbi:MAG TPA: sialidase family protein, partial [Thermoanaerobaculia bacterium]|nr:sialidase family protein [Thermoanaerobaculia bacterium]